MNRFANRSEYNFYYVMLGKGLQPIAMPQQREIRPSLLILDLTDEKL